MSDLTVSVPRYLPRCPGVVFVVCMSLVAMAPSSSICDELPSKEQNLKSRPILEIRQSTTLDPKQTYGAIVVIGSDIVIDGQGAWLIGNTSDKPKDFKGTAISATGVKNVTLKNVNAKGWETGLKVLDSEKWTIENCDFSNNFHDPDFGWGENGRRGGIVLERVNHSTLRKNKANSVWDACVLVNSNDNVIEDNDFSRTSNTCLKLWTACRNTIRKNALSHGIRISPGEVHARDSTSVLIESGSNDNRLIENDCTHGGDGIFVRVLNGWCSSGNLFEKNDCSFANNNGVECWAPENVFIKNKANHCSYGFWLGGSDKTKLIDNEASYNGMATGHHNSPHLPNDGHAGIVFMFGPSSHTIARGNVCCGNNGAGIALVGDLDSQGRKWRAYHWIIEENKLTENRWGLYAKHADWLTLTDNEFNNNTVKDVLFDGDVTRSTEVTHPKRDRIKRPLARLDGPSSAKLGELATWSGKKSRVSDTDDSEVVKAETNGLVFSWDVGDGQIRNGPELKHAFDRVGFHRIGLNVSNGHRTDLTWRDLYVVREVSEIGTEGDATNWSIEDFHERTRSNEQISRAVFTDSETGTLVGKRVLSVAINPYAGFRVALRYPKSNDGRWSLKGKSKLVFWLKSINEDVTGWQGGPFITIHGENEQRRLIEPREGRDLMRQLDNNESRDGWRLMQIPLNGDEQWTTDGELPEIAHSISLGFDSWGAPPLRLWIDGMAFE